MKKILYLALAAFALFSCNKEMTIVEEESQPQPLKYVFNVAEKPSFDADTRAGKDSWVEGDKIYIVFDDVLPKKYEDFTILEYKTVDSDLEWVITEGSNKPQNTGGKLDALYYENINPRVLYDAKHIFFDYQSPSAGQHVYLIDNNVNYNVQDNTVEFSLSMGFQTDITYVQFRVTGLDGEWNFGLKDSQHESNSFEMPTPVWHGTSHGFMSSGILYGENDITAVPMGIRTDGHYEYLIVNQKAEAITITLENATTGDSYYKTFDKKITGKSAAITFRGPKIVDGVITNGWTIASGKINGHEYVNMGNGLKWATMNLGASKPEDFGDYYAWGETATKDTYTIMNYVLADIPENAAYPENTGWIYINKYTFDDKAESILGDLAVWYNASGEFIGDNKSTFADYNYEDDAARTLWESTWRTPTKEEYQWLLDDNNCSSEFVEDYHKSGEGGMLFTSKVNGNELFFPLAGSIRDKFYEGYGHYWTATRSSNESDYALVFGFQNNGKCSLSDGDRFLGFTIRPVSD